MSTYNAEAARICKFLEARSNLIGMDPEKISCLFIDDKTIPLLKDDVRAVVNHYDDIMNALDFEPDAYHTIADMANCGRSMIDMIVARCPGASWNESPAEVIGDLVDEREILMTELQTLFALFQMIGSDVEATYEAAKSNKPLAISIGQFRRLSKSRELVGQMLKLNPDMGKNTLNHMDFSEQPNLEEQPDGTVTAVDPTDKGLTP